MRVLQLQGRHTWEDGCQMLSRLPRPHIAGPPLLERQYPQTRPHTDQTPEAHTRVSKALPAPVEHQGRHRQVTHRPTTQDTHNRDHVIQVPLALSATGSPSVPKTPQPGMKKITTSFIRETQSKQRPSCPFLAYCWHPSEGQHHQHSPTIHPTN